MRKVIIRYVLMLLAAAVAAGCASKGVDSDGRPLGYDREVYTPSEATGFTIEGDTQSDNTLVTVGHTWQGSSGKKSYLLIDRGGGVPAGFDGAVVKGDAKRIVAMSSTYIAMLDAVDALDRLVGVSGIRFVANAKVAANADRLVDVGNEAAVDFEKIVMLDPDLVLIYGVDGPSAMEEKLRELGVPYLYIGDYLEQSPLGKAEWVVAIGEIVGQRDRAEEYYAAVRDRYMAECQTVAAVENRPKVMFNAPYSGSWFMPGSENYIVRLITDAGAEYVYPENQGDKSRPVDIERAYMLASSADVWLNPCVAGTLDELRATLPQFADCKPVVNGTVYDNTLRSTPGGGNDFYESGAVHPDAVLADLIAIFHPELSANKQLTYFKQLP